ncbi:cell division protein CrgA [Herbiconiux solani]|uniref:cell division protein CrgA n=1 Tax=Herbiconiux solani TaxID=661329 RepID=UPI0009FF2CC7|nr:cell division protein CrgA [Herbiconiux solani]
MARDKAPTKDLDRRNRDVQRTSRDESSQAPNPVWFKPVMFGFMIIGLLWIIVFYVSQGLFPIPDLGSWNILVGFGIAFIGFIMTTRWR